MLSVIVWSVGMSSDTMLNVIKQNVIMLSVMYGVVESHCVE
jgi:hypothetical protein